MAANQPLYKVETLTLTSPHMRDGHGALRGSHLIRNLQWLLNNNSKNSRNNDKSFGDYYNGALDGEYGPYTSGAVHKAKFFLGYPNGQVDGNAGPVLEAYLRGEKKLPLLYITRRNLRIAQAKKAQTIREEAYAKAVTQLGTKESPAGSNRVLYSYWYGIIGSWCAMFVTWNFVNVGSKRFVRASRYAYVPYIVADAHAGRNGLHLTTMPVRGDIVCYDWNRDGTADHTGIFEGWVSQSRGIFTAIEGNTSTLNWSNGGEVARQTRSTFQVQAFVHVLEP